MKYLLQDVIIFTISLQQFATIQKYRHRTVVHQLYQHVRSKDARFHGQSLGRTDLPGGSYKQILESIKNKLLVLDDGVGLLPGHGPYTSVGWERRRNPFLQ